MEIILQIIPAITFDPFDLHRPYVIIIIIIIIIVVVVVVVVVVVIVLVVVTVIINCRKFILVGL